MKSRTAEGKHTPRFIVEYASGPEACSGQIWRHSHNSGHEGFFETREDAQAALTPASIADGFKYRIRQK
jgi:hypothetical protein